MNRIIHKWRVYKKVSCGCDERSSSMTVCGKKWYNWDEKEREINKVSNNWCNVTCPKCLDKKGALQNNVKQ